jgi:hypothetical protein
MRGHKPSMINGTAQARFRRILLKNSPVEAE